MPEFSTQLKRLRKENNLTQYQLAKKLQELGCKISSKSAISQYENNRRIPETKDFAIIAKFFKVQMNYLFGNSDTTEEESIILSLFRRLDENDKKKLRSYLCKIIENNKIEKNNY